MSKHYFLKSESLGLCMLEEEDAKVGGDFDE